MKIEITLDADQIAKWGNQDYRDGFIAGVEKAADGHVHLIEFLNPGGQVVDTRRRNSWRDA